ncbi:DUF2029 domain-containing protein [Patescibacteria group bacterium]|nr:DUF2029 domain-containing protein [Patescibacteria group bacterium]
MEKLASGEFDFSIPGFHGSNVFALPWYWITSSEFAAIEIQLFFALILPLCAYLAGKALFDSKWHGLMLAGIITMMPFVSVISKIGYTSSGLFVLMLLTIYGVCRGRWWAGVTFGLAILTKPFALALLPLLWIKRPTEGKKLLRYQALLVGISIPVLYVIVQYLQVGHVIVGVHPELNESTVWQGPMKVLMNLAYALQVLFSVHNYHYPNPGGTGHENLLHTTPILMFLGLFAFLAPSKFFPDRKLFFPLFIGAAIGFGMNAIVATMNEYYMQAGMLLVILAALPVLKKYPLWIPFVLATLHFQWFYFYLAFSERLQLGLLFCAAPVVVDLIFLVWIYEHFLGSSKAQNSLN